VGRQRSYPVLLIFFVKFDRCLDEDLNEVNILDVAFTEISTESLLSVAMSAGSALKASVMDEELAEDDSIECSDLTDSCDVVDNNALDTAQENNEESCCRVCIIVYTVYCI